ncbi:MAG: glycosyltransferase [Elusimicrobiota bacterium]
MNPMNETFSDHDKMKILILGNAKGSEYSGVDFVNEMMKYKYTESLDYVEFYLKNGFSPTHEHIARYVTSNGFNVLIFAPNFFLDIVLLRKLLPNIFLIYSVSDTEHYFEVINQYQSQIADLVLVTDFATPSMFNWMGVNAMTYWGFFDPIRYRNIPGIKKTIDVSFIGLTKHKLSRSTYIQYLQNNGVDVKIFGDDTPEGKIAFEEKILTFNKSKINLNFSGITDETTFTTQFNIHKRRLQLKGRIIESALCGSFSLTEYAPGTELLFNIGEEIDVFRDKEELLDKIRYYLKYDEKRERMALKGHLRAIKDYDVKSVVPMLFKTVNAQRKIKKYKDVTIYLDSIYLKIFTSFRFRLIFKFVKMLKFKLIFEELSIILRHKTVSIYQIYVYFIEEFLQNSGLFKMMKRILNKN